MPWGRLDDTLHSNGKVWSFSDKAFRVWMYSISYCNQKRLKDPEGLLSEAEGRQLCQLSRAGKAIVSELLEKGGWERKCDGYRVHDFEHYGPKVDATAAERQRRRRDARRSHGLVTRDSHGEVTHPVPVPVPVPVPIPVPTTSEHQPTEATVVHDLLSAPPEPERAPPAPKSLEPRYSADFEEWWLAYPRKREKVEAFGVYEKTLKAGATVDQLLAASRNYATAAEQDGAEVQFIKLPATFLSIKDRPWLDFRDGVPRPERTPMRDLAVNGRSAPHRGKRGSTDALLDRVFGGKHDGG